MNAYTISQLQVGVTEQFTVEITRDKMELFFAITGDASPLHRDAAYARERGYPDRVSYGMLQGSFISTLAGVYLPGETCLLHAVSCKFTKPVFAGDVLTVCGKVEEMDTGLGVVSVKVTVTNQKGEKVLRGSYQAGVAR